MLKPSNAPMGILFLVLFSACASTNVIQLGDGDAAAKPENCKIKVLSEAPRERKFEDLCLITARGSQAGFGSKSVDTLLPDIKKKACECGADAIIIKNSKEGGYNLRGPAERAEASATAIRYVQKETMPVSMKARKSRKLPSHRPSERLWRSHASASNG